MGRRGWDDGVVMAVPVLAVVVVVVLGKIVVVVVGAITPSARASDLVPLMERSEGV